MIDIAKLIENYPNIKIWSLVYGECEASYLYSDLIETRIDGECMNVDQYGRYSSKGECLIFPSKGVRDWNVVGAKYVRGCESSEYIAKILKQNGGVNEYDWNLASNSDIIYYIGNDDKIINICCKDSDTASIILSTGTELKEDSYYNNKQQKIITLFKEFDRVVAKNNAGYWFPYIIGFYDGELKLYRAFSCDSSYEGLLHPSNVLPYNEKTAKLIGTNNEYKEE